MKKKGFSLIELLVVIALIGIVYGIYFYTINQSKKPIKFSLDNMRTYLKDASNKYETFELKLLYDFDDKVIYLVNKENKLLEKIAFKEEFTQYLLKENEKLEVAQYKNIDIDDHFFEPKMVYKMLKKDTFSNIILSMPDNNWRYYNSYFGEQFVSFDDEVKLINYIKKTEYLPMSAGKVE